MMYAGLAGTVTGPLIEWADDMGYAVTGMLGAISELEGSIIGATPWPAQLPGPVTTLSSTTLVPSGAMQSSK
jgi:hypothetical protein